jgi:hypothetical protein
LRIALSGLRAFLGIGAAALALGAPARARGEGGNYDSARDRTTVTSASDAAAAVTPHSELDPDESTTTRPWPGETLTLRQSGDGRPPRKFAMSALGTVAALVPGVVVHGTGHLVVGDTKTGLRLLALEGAGLGVLATGFVPLVATGASRRLIGPAIVLTATGFGLFAISFLADIYGVVAPAGGVGAPFRSTAWLQTALGYRYVHDPVFAYRNFIVQEIDYRAGPWRVNPSAWFALDDTNSRVRTRFAYRLTGPLPEGNPAVRDGSFLDIEAALTRHTFTRERFATTTGEIAVAGRLDMARVGPSLRGSFAEMSVGWALQAYSYRARGTTADVGELLLTRFGYGMYLGFPGSPRGEVTIYYDHRHDDFAAGFKMPGLGSGTIGHFGAEGRLLLTDHWGIAAETAFGSAYVMGLSILFRQGNPL